MEPTKKSPFGSILKWSAIISVMIVGPLLVTESWFRLKPVEVLPIGEKPKVEIIFESTMARIVQPRIDRGWARPASDRPNLFSPPLDTFVNSGFDDEDRLARIAEKMRLPPSQTWRVPNFLRNPEDDSLHTITSNSLRFRGGEHPKEKAKDVFRIIALGSYPVFGHGVNDDETYPFVLEKQMNSKEWLARWSKYSCRKIKRVEVWNGGRQGATAIMGYARLKFDVEALSPDILIWDFGWIDSYLRSDEGAVEGINVMRIRKLSESTRSIRKACRKSLIRNSEICHRFEREVTAIDRQQSLVGWGEANRLAVAWAKVRNIPIFIIRHQGVSIDRKLYEPLNHPEAQAYFIDTSDAINWAHPTSAEIGKFWSKKNWVQEAGFTRGQTQDNPLIVLRADAIQYNELGYARIAKYLALESEKLLGDKKLVSRCQK
ncbi:hypothetical protein BH10BDE1_BH10BDE1_29910 [soil metagenome]